MDEILAAMDKGCKPLGFDTFDEAIRTGNAQLMELIEENRKLEDREALRRTLEAAPDISPENRRKLVEEVVNAIYTLRRFAAIEIKAMPHHPGGRKPLDLHNHVERVLTEVLELYGKGVHLRDAFVRIGKRYGVSARTIQRIWHARERVEAADE